ncbi:mediator of RNA polymerase II transcription subunit 15a isoform X1 [Olea europaea subsp. europaea]|uniref:Mediator of RNA polymerase II transcription subunit 15a isoform X1 n=1 Tax=Olea europaea subsp. europaea TaxID=158383 RepID=A0A8S0TS73_OLEEU|nr:mediator of RNA polymerase II transcription subunit 15a isoform X1 [Olea europaea subsp. europaea]
MDGNNWRANSGQAHVPGQVIGGEAPVAPGMDAGDWRTQLPADSRQRIVNKIMETLKRHLPFAGHEGLQELKERAERFEEKTYASATSQSDYLRKISLKMLTMGTKTQNPVPISLQSNVPSNSENPQDPASQSMQAQIPSQGQPLPIPMANNRSQSRQQLLSQNIQNNIPSTGVPNSASLTSGLPTVGGVSQATMPNVVGQNPNVQNLQNISSVTPNVVGNSMGQGVPSNMFANTQRSNQGRQQSVVPQEQQQQQSQNSQQYLYSQQFQHHLMKQKFQQGNISQSLMQSQIQQQQQQNLLQPTQIQSSQQAVMQPSLRQSQSTQSLLQQQSQSVLRQQPQQQPQQSSLTHQQQTSMPQHPILPTQQQQQLSGNQLNATSMQQNQLIGQQNNILDAQHQQQQQRIMSQQNNHSNLQQQQTIGQQNIPNIHQQQSIAQQNSLLNMHQQQLGPQTNVSGFQQQQMVGIQSGNSGLQSSQQSVLMLQPSKVAQQQMQQNVGNLLPNQAQQSQSQLPQQQMMSQIQSQPGQLQQQLGLQQHTNSLQRDMHQRIQTSGPLLQQHSALDQQKHPAHSQSAIPEAPLYVVRKNHYPLKIAEKVSKTFRENYNLLGVENPLPSNFHDSVPLQPKNEQLEKLKFFKAMLERIILFLRIPKNEVQQIHKEKIVGVEKQINNILNLNKPRKSVSSVQQGHLSQPHLHTIQQSQQPQSQMHPHDNQMNLQTQPVNVQGSVAATQQNNTTNLQNNSLSSISGVSNSRQNIMDGLQSGSNMDPGQGNAPNSLQQVAMGSLQQNPVSGPQQANYALEEELREINERLIDTVVYISDEDVDPTAAAATAKGGDGTIVKCSFSAVALSPSLKSQYASAQMSPIQPLRVLVPNNYPNCSPILLDKFPVEVSKEYEDISIKAKSRFNISLRSLSQPMSLKEIARTWGFCALAVIIFVLVLLFLSMHSKVVEEVLARNMGLGRTA